MEGDNFQRAANFSRGDYRTRAPVQFRQPLFALQAPSFGSAREETPCLVTIPGHSMASEIHVA
jgi:hypothetical protein